jgi:hypothetical protein
VWPQNVRMDYNTHLAHSSAVLPAEDIWVMAQALP